MLFLKEGKPMANKYIKVVNITNHQEHVSQNYNERSPLPVRLTTSKRLNRTIPG